MAEERSVKNQKTKILVSRILVGVYVLFAALICSLFVIFASVRTYQNGDDLHTNGKPEVRTYEVKEDVFYVCEQHDYDHVYGKEYVNGIFFLPQGTKYEDDIDSISMHIREFERIDLEASTVIHNESDGTKKELDRKEKTEWLSKNSGRDSLELPMIGVDADSVKVDLEKNGSDYSFSGEYEGILKTEHVTIYRVSNETTQLQYKLPLNIRRLVILILISVTFTVLLIVFAVKKQFRNSLICTAYGVFVLYFVFRVMVG